MSKIIFVNRFYRPDHSATAQLLTDLAERLAIDGLRVTVVASRQRYQDAQANLPAGEILAGVDIHRVWTSQFGRSNLPGRALDYLSFYLSSLLMLLWLVRRGDVLVVKTDPPMLSVIGAAVAKIKGAKLINWLQDLFPEVAMELGVRLNRPLYSLLKSLRDWSLRAADSNVVLGELMAVRITTCTGAPEKICIIHNWVLDQNLHPVAAEDNTLRREWNLSGKFVVGYSGNLGRAHDYQTVYRAAEKLRNNSSIVFLFIGSGAGFTVLENLAQRSQMPNMIFKPYQPLERLNLSLTASDVHWASLAPQLEGLIVPSKAYGILAAGRPLLFIGSENGEIARMIINSDCGTAIAPGDVDALTNWLLDAAKNRDQLDALSANARFHYENHFAQGISMQKWCQLLHGMLPSAQQ